MSMDSTFFYRVVEAVDRSLTDAGRTGFRLSLADGPGAWFDAAWLFDYLDEQPYQKVPFLWEGVPLAPFDRLSISRFGRRRYVFRHDRLGRVFVTGDVVLAYFLPPSESPVLVTGERRPGALQKFLDAYLKYANARAGRNSWIIVVGDADIPRPEGITWNDLFLPAAMRDDIRMQVEGFFAARSLYDRLGVPYRRGLLLAGPPGNGKTTLFRVLASQRREAIVLFKPYAGMDSGDLESAFEKAEAYAPSILCFEDVDSLFQGSITLSEFLNRMDGLASLEGVLVLATTNHPEKLDAAITDRPSRFDRVYLLPAPAPPERRAYLRRCFGSLFDERLVEWTDGLSMAQLKEVWVSACLEAIHHGGSEPTFEGARQAVRKLKGQKDALDRDWEPAKSVGFQRSLTS